jgi:multiple sugar transport system substrate-binding protein
MKATAFDGKVYGIPQDFAPLMMFYRVDVFKKYGLAVPTTWDQYAQEAKTLHQKAPKVSMTNFDANDPGWFTSTSTVPRPRRSPATGRRWSRAATSRRTPRSPRSGTSR